MSVTKRVSKKNGKSIATYQADVYVAGVRAVSKRFANKTEAHVWHDKAKQEVEAGKYFAHQQESKYLFCDMVTDYRNTEYCLLRKSTQQSKDSWFLYLLEGPLAKLPVLSIDAGSIDKWLEWLKQHPTASHSLRKSFVKEFKALGVVLNWYRENHNPAYIPPLLKRHRKACHYKPVEQRRSDYYMRPEEVRAWLVQLEKRPDPVYYRLGLFLALTGWRLGEGTGLDWKDVNLERGIARITQTLSWDYKTKVPYIQLMAKTESSIRPINLPKPLVEMLKVMPRREGLVFQNKKGRPVHDNVVRDNFNAAFTQAGIPYTGTRIMRHTFATLSLVASGDKASVQATLGHSSSKQTDTYAKIVAFRDNDVPEQMAKFVGL